MKKLVLLLIVCAMVSIVFVTTVQSRYRPYITSSYSLTTFPDDYIVEKKDKVTVVVPEVFELFHVVLALSNEQGMTEDIVETESGYYDEVIASFNEYAGHTAIDEVTDALRTLGLTRFGALFTYQFEDDRIVYGGVHDHEMSETAIESILPALESFADASNFRQFYSEKEPYYNHLRSHYEDTVDAYAMWSWLEDGFSLKYDHYRIVTSPLMGGHHFSHNFRDKENDFHEIVAYVPVMLTALSNMPLEEGVIETLTLERLLFTEVSHQYVNPTTDKLPNRMRVVRVMEETDRWYEKDGYDSPTLVFNEYMTWSLYNLYVMDHHEEDAHAANLDLMNFIMEERRGFIQFGTFDRTLHGCYSTIDKPIEKLYRPLLRRLS